MVRYQNERLTAIQFVACCGFAAEQSKAVLIKNGDDAQNVRDVRKILMMESKDRKCYMYLKFHIYPPYIVSVINFILTHAFFFP